MSLAAGELRRVGSSAFRADHDHCWLVLEAGGTQSASPGVTPPVTARSRRLRDPIVVPMRDQGAARGQLTLGRQARCDLVLAEATISQVHLLFMLARPGEWTVRAAKPRNGALLQGEPLAPGVPALLADGVTLQIGAVRLTYHDPDGFLRRLQQAEEPTAQAG